MSNEFDAQRDVLGPMLAASLWSWSESVFKPAQALRSLGLYHPMTIGVPPSPQRFRGGGPELSGRHPEPVLLRDAPGHYDSVEAFDHCAGDYEAAVKPFSQPIFEDVLAAMEPFLVPDARILDPSAGPGSEAMVLARAVPQGEVVAADLSRGMVETAWRNARAAGIQNMAFFQADVAAPPAELEGYFDAVFCCLAFHHYPDGAAAARAFHRVLAPGGKVFLADPGPKWFNDMSRQFALLADPGFIQHRTGHDFQLLFREAGFSAVYWVETLPGIGLTIASR